MNRSEQKERLKDILSSIKELKETLKDKKEELSLLHSKIDELNETPIGNLDSWDADELKKDVFYALVGESFEGVYSELVDFQDDLESHLDELSETRREKLEEKYIDLELALEKFDFDGQEYDGIDNAIEHIEEAEELIKEMKK